MTKGENLDTSIKIINVGSDEYKLALSLRELELRKPLGLSLSKSDLSEEDQQTHFGAFRNTDLIAVCAMKPSGEGAVQLRQMAVSPEYRNQGLGHQILDAAERWAKSEGMSEIWMEARSTAIEFYQKKGYRIVSQPFEHLGITHIKMSKDIQ
jgi:predicted GNAT family N-acyltransferase